MPDKKHAFLNKYCFLNESASRRLLSWLWNLQIIREESFGRRTIWTKLHKQWVETRFAFKRLWLVLLFVLFFLPPHFNPRECYKSVVLAVDYGNRIERLPSQSPLPFQCAAAFCREGSCVLGPGSHFCPLPLWSRIYPENPVNQKRAQTSRGGKSNLLAILPAFGIHYLCADSQSQFQTETQTLIQATLIKMAIDSGLYQRGWDWILDSRL